MPKLLPKWTLFTLILLGLFAHADPPHGEYKVHSGGQLDIPHGAFVEGSLSHGGIQPDYFVDLNEEQLQSFLKKAEEIGQADVHLWDKIARIIELMNTDAFKQKNYGNRKYRGVGRRAKEEQRPVQLGEYLSCGAGTCREFGLVLHLAIKAAGIPNRYTYVENFTKIDEQTIIREDHAVVIVTYKNVDWVVDAYNDFFNGFRLQDLMSEEGVTFKSPRTPFSIPYPFQRRILQINHYPRVWIPLQREEPTSCKKILTDSSKEAPRM